MIDGVRLRRAEPGDTDSLAELLASEEVEPFLAAVSAREHDELLAEIERSLAEPNDFGRFVIEVREGEEWRRAGFAGEGRRRRARWRHGCWVDGVLFGLTCEHLADREGQAS